MTAIQRWSALAIAILAGAAACSSEDADSSTGGDTTLVPVGDTVTASVPSDADTGTTVPGTGTDSAVPPTDNGADTSIDTTPSGTDTAGTDVGSDTTPPPSDTGVDTTTPSDTTPGDTGTSVDTGDEAGDWTVYLHPGIRRSIGGHVAVDRNQVVNLSHPGNGFESRVDSDLVTRFLDQLDMRFGRDLGGVYTAVRWSNAVFEDPDNPGTIDIDRFAQQVSPKDDASDWMRSHFGGRLDVALHDRHNAYPAFMETYSTTEAPDEKYPSNLDAAAAFVAAMLRYGYSDFTRPTTYELVNEPHWSVWSHPTFADWHVRTWKAVHDAGIDVAIGGPCLSVATMYKNNYQKLSTLTNFIDNTAAVLDFYSFHAYDYMHWDDAAHTFVGRVSTGLPLEGVLDALAAYVHNNYDKAIQIVLSEHGGYLSNDDQNIISTALATQLLGPGSGFDWEMRRRAVGNDIMVRSALANTLLFLDHPHVVRKAVPFILLETFGWDPHYYASLLVARNFTDKGDWVESALIQFYELLAGFAGDRVKVLSRDPDIQVHAAVSDGTLHLLLNNLSEESHDVRIALPEGLSLGAATVTRLQRQDDFTGRLIRSSETDISTWTLGPKEAVAVHATLSTQPAVRYTAEETDYYGDKTAVQVDGTAAFSVDVADLHNVDYAWLRVGLGRPAGTDHGISVRVNGVDVAVPMEDAAPLLDNGNEYASTKKVLLPLDILKAHNTVEITTTDGRPAGVGAVVLRVATAHP